MYIKATALNPENTLLKSVLRVHDYPAEPLKLLDSKKVTILYLNIKDI